MTVSAEIIQVVWLTVQLALVTTVILLLLTVPLAWWIARSRSFFAEIVATLATLPLILPPTVLGFYLLVALGPSGPFAWAASLAGTRSFVFSFEGLVIGSVIFSLPFALQPLRNAFEAVPEALLDTAATLRANPFARFRLVALPLSRRGVLSAAILSFAHTVGEFGVVLLIGGNIPGETRVMSIALFEYIETLRWAEAHLLAGAMLGFAFVVIFALSIINGRAPGMR